MSKRGGRLDGEVGGSRMAMQRMASLLTTGEAYPPSSSELLSACNQRHIFHLPRLTRNQYRELFSEATMDMGKGEERGGGNWYIQVSIF